MTPEEIRRRPMKFADRIALIAGGPDECWLWPLAKSAGGYGHVQIQGRKVLAHRSAYELLVGPIPDGLHIDHLCRNRACINPAHMEPVTRKINTLRGIGFAAVNAAKTHCKYGHPFDTDNTMAVKKGRRCRACKRAWENEYLKRPEIKAKRAEQKKLQQEGTSQ